MGELRATGCDLVLSCVPWMRNILLEIQGFRHHLPFSGPPMRPSLFSSERCLLPQRGFRRLCGALVGGLLATAPAAAEDIHLWHAMAGELGRQLEPHWGAGLRQVHWPLSLRVGRSGRSG